MHEGTSLTFVHINILGVRNSVKSLIRKCTTCIRHKPQASQQLMGQLPEARVNPLRPFLHTGVDYAGLIQIKMSKDRGNKSCEGCHIEVVSDMTTDAFLTAFRRFTARRGFCAHMYSDNGTNFVGAANLLQKDIVRIVKSGEIQDKSTLQGTQWHFIPPSSPNKGGIWKANIKAHKFHLKRVTGTSTLAYEGMETLTQVAGCLNIRPLLVIRDDCNYELINPAHFLLGNQLRPGTTALMSDINTNTTERWKLVQRMRKDIWDSWSKSYMNTLQQRNKWRRPVKSIDKIRWSL